MKTIIHKLQFGTVPPKNRRRKRPTTNASNGGEGRPPPPGPNFPYIEVVNGRAAMYGISIRTYELGSYGFECG